MITGSDRYTKKELLRMVRHWVSAGYVQHAWSLGAGRGYYAMPGENPKGLS